MDRRDASGPSRPRHWKGRPGGRRLTVRLLIALAFGALVVGGAVPLLNLSGTAKAGEADCVNVSGKIVTSGQADMVALARGMLYDARWPWHAAARLGAKLHGPRQYLRAPPSTVKELFHPAAAG